MRRCYMKLMMTFAAMSTGGMLYSCSPVPVAINGITSVNPCGTILNCNPIEYDLALHGTYPDYAIDPTCTIPGFCGGTPFPGTGGQGQGNPPSDIGTGSGAISNTSGTTGGTTTGATTGI